MVTEALAGLANDPVLLATVGLDSLLVPLLPLVDGLGVAALVVVLELPLLAIDFFVSWDSPSPIYFFFTFSISFFSLPCHFFKSVGMLATLSGAYFL